MFKANNPETDIHAPIMLNANKQDLSLHQLTKLKPQILNQSYYKVIEKEHDNDFNRGPPRSLLGAVRPEASVSVRRHELIYEGHLC